MYVFWLTVQLSTMDTPVKLRLKKETAATKRNNNNACNFVCNFIWLVVECLSVHYDCRSLYFIIHLAHLFLFRHIIPACVCVFVLVTPKTLPISSSVCFFFMSCCLAFNAFYLLYFLAIRLWTFVLVRNCACLSISFSISLFLAVPC